MTADRTGELDGQLPVPGIAAQLHATDGNEWPSVIERDGFCDLVSEVYQLTHVQSSVLRRILFRAGKATKACYESQANIARYLRLHERTVNQTLKFLEAENLIVKVKQFHGSGKSNGYIPRLVVANRMGSAIPDSQSEMANFPIPDSQSGLDAPFPILSASIPDCGSYKQEGTDNVIDDSSFEENTSEEKVITTPLSITSSVHSRLTIGNGGEQPDSQSEMDEGPAVDVPECVGGCGQPWATPDKHLQALMRSKKFGMTLEPLCNDCWQRQCKGARERAGLAAC